MNPSAPSLHSRREALGLGASGLGLAVAGSVLNAVRAQATTDEPGAARSAGPLQSAGAMTLAPAMSSSSATSLVPRFTLSRYGMRI